MKDEHGLVNQSKFSTLFSIKQTKQIFIDEKLSNGNERYLLIIINWKIFIMCVFHGSLSKIDCEMCLIYFRKDFFVLNVS